MLGSWEAERLVGRRQRRKGEKVRKKAERRRYTCNWRTLRAILGVWGSVLKFQILVQENY
jgi:hypothetical protein